MGSAWTKEHEKHSSQQSFSDVRDVQFKDNSTYNFRFLPQKSEKSVPFVGYTIHWIPQQNSKKGKPIVHPIDKRCCVDSYVSDLWGEINRLKEEEDLTDNHPKVKAIQEKIRAVRGQQKYDFNVLDRDDLMHEVGGKKKMAGKRLTSPSSVWKSLFDYAANPKWGDPSDEKTGYDIKVTTEGEGVKRQYTILPDRESSPLTDEEKEVLKTVYDLDKLRQPTSQKDMRDIIMNAKQPFDELIPYLDDSSDSPSSSKSEKSETKKEEPKEVKKEEPKETKKEEPKEVKKEEPKETKKEERVEEKEPKEQTEASEIDNLGDTNDPKNINSYECRGEYEESEELCRGCDVKEDCVTYQPIYKRSVEWNTANPEKKIDISAKRSVKRIEEDLKAAASGSASTADSSPKFGKKKSKDIPF
jgi:outer membrane biosynthesis protein TonB